MAFQIGQKVVCVREFPCGPFDELVPLVNRVYTIRCIEIFANTAFINLVEIVNEPRQYRDEFVEMRFNSGYFRPLVDRKTDISIFTEMLHKEPATC